MSTSTYSVLIGKLCPLPTKSAVKNTGNHFVFLLILVPVLVLLYPQPLVTTSCFALLLSNFRFTFNFFFSFFTYADRVPLPPFSVLFHPICSYLLGILAERLTSGRGHLGPLRKLCSCRPLSFLVPSRSRSRLLQCCLKRSYRSGHLYSVR